MFEDIVKIFVYREVLLNMVIREIKVRYKQSVLGGLWAVIQPLAMMAMFTVIFSYFIKIPSDGKPYPVFSFAALLPWTFFATALSFAIPSIVSNMNLITKIYFPREIFPLASIMAAFIDFCIAAVVFAVMLILYKIPLSINALYILPIMILQIMFILGISLLASAINVYYRDVRFVIPFVIQLWMYASPVIYPVSIVPGHLKNLYMLNPMAPIIDGYRRVLILGVKPDFFYLGIASIIITALLLFSYRFFKKVEMSFADMI